jgi:acetolactate synthase-1/2/3 large subunit
VPLVAITGNVQSSLLGTDAFQETDIVGVTIPITKWNHQITSAKDIPLIFTKAFNIANSGRPGPILIDITKDALIEKFNWEDVDFKIKNRGKHVNQFSYKDVETAAELINSAQQPLVLVGHGVLISKAEQELLAFVTKAQIPVAVTLLGISAFDAENPLYVGMLGMHGNYAPNVQTNKADLIIAVGMRFDDRVTGMLQAYAKQAKIIHIDIDAVEIGKIIKPDVALVGCAKEVLNALMLKVDTAEHTEWLESFKPAADKEQQAVISSAITVASGPLKMSEVVALLSEMTTDSAIVVSDVGQQQMITARYYKFKNSRNYISSGGLGTMGFGLPAGIGAKIAMPNREVIVVAGDGGIQMTIQELGTIMQENLNLKIIILNNSFLGMVRQWQELFFQKRYSCVHLTNPDFVKISEAYGISALEVREREELKTAIQTMLEAPGAFLLNVLVEKEQNVFPMLAVGSAVSDIKLERDEFKL